MSSRPAIAVVVVPSLSSYGTATKQSNSGETQPTIPPSTAAPESLQYIDQSINAFHITNNYSSTGSTPSTEDKELTYLLHNVSEPFYSILKRYHLSRRSIQTEERRRFTTIHTNHHSLRALAQAITSASAPDANLHPKPALDQLMENHATQLHAIDSALDTWAAQRSHASDIMARINERLVAENSRQVSVNARREATVRFYDGDGRGSWLRGRREKWMADQMRRREAYRKWVGGFRVWEGTYAVIVGENRECEEELEVLRERQEVLGRWVGNWLIGRFFEEVEMLNAEDSGAV